MGAIAIYTIIIIYIYIYRHVCLNTYIIIYCTMSNIIIITMIKLEIAHMLYGEYLNSHHAV